MLRSASGFGLSFSSDNWEWQARLKKGHSLSENASFPLPCYMHVGGNVLLGNSSGEAGGNSIFMAKNLYMGSRARHWLRRNIPESDQKLARPNLHCDLPCRVNDSRTTRKMARKLDGYWISIRMSDWETLCLGVPLQIKYLESFLRILLSRVNVMSGWKTS